MPAQPQWIFPSCALLHTPSQANNKQVTLQVELAQRSQASNWAYRIVSTLFQSQREKEEHLVLVWATACMFIHRFYMRADLGEYSFKDLATTAVYLAFKDTEHMFKIKYIVRIVLAKQNRELKINQPVLDDSPEFKTLQSKILALEEILIHTLCFELIPPLPYQPFSRGLRRLHSVDTNIKIYKSWEMTGWSLINYSFNTPLCVLQSPETIAVAAYVCVRCLMCDIPLSELEHTFDTYKTQFGIVDQEDLEVKHYVSRGWAQVEECIAWMRYPERSFSVECLGPGWADRRPLPLPVSKGRPTDSSLLSSAVDRKLSASPSLLPSMANSPMNSPTDDSFLPSQPLKASSALSNSSLINPNNIREVHKITSAALPPPKPFNTTTLSLLPPAPSSPPPLPPSASPIPSSASLLRSNTMNDRPTESPDTPAATAPTALATCLNTPAPILVVDEKTDPNMEEREEGEVDE
ncbi:CDK9 kinase-activating protein cyclin T [Phaffia rhodozyma]|uniref:CDK9 kinase-activating protein cyclin T n=1 Tax=Phaffia rhodozyma TaxID=264483 RepID=A0A0F7SUI3_PHARH|nr:CDK9 kinase-activating protein cyclin T [Phaffia rhodozyma]